MKVKSKHLVFVGLPGCGKGTQANKLKEEYSAVIVATGALLRKKAQSDSPLGLRIRASINAGRLVEAETVNTVVQDFVVENLKNNYDLFIWDGYPRDCNQAVHFLSILDSIGVPRSSVTTVYIDLPKNLAIDRLSNRLQCSNCDAIYNTKDDHVYVDLSKCDKCGAVLAKREDDNHQTISKRTEYAKMELGKVIDFLQLNGINVLEVDGSLSRNEIFEHISHYCK